MITCRKCGRRLSNETKRCPNCNSVVGRCAYCSSLSPTRGDLMDEIRCSIKFRCIKIGGKIYARNTTEYDFNERCAGCGIENRLGNLHHYGCDVEKCPSCGEQLINCSCKKEAIGVNNKWTNV